MRRYLHTIEEDEPSVAIAAPTVTPTSTSATSSSSSSFLSSGYTLVLCGHSFGAVLACRLGAAMRDAHRDIKVRVYAFGPPPCLSSTSSSTSSSKSQSHNPNCCSNSNINIGECNENKKDHSYITFVVNNHDCVPRWTESNLMLLGKLLRRTMHRKLLHFCRYYGRYRQQQQRQQQRQHEQNQHSLQTTASRSLARIIPPFSLSFRDWSKFWNSNQEELQEGQAQLRLQLQMQLQMQMRGGKNRPGGVVGGVEGEHKREHKHKRESNYNYIVPGRVVCIWNNSQDPSIIGAKVHRPRMVAQQHGNSNPTHNHRRGADATDAVWEQLWIDETMFRDHTIEAYRSNLELLLGQVANTI